MKNSLVLLTIGLALPLRHPLAAQTFKVLHSFTAPDPTYGTNSDGTGSIAGSLALSGNTLYGTGQGGGDSGTGTIFALSTDGTGFRTLHSFSAYDTTGIANSDGTAPISGLMWSDGTLYGATQGGGPGASGTVFAISPDGTGFTTVYTFTALDTSTTPRVNSDGARPWAAPILTGNTLYGTADGGGNFGSGTVFAVNLDGTVFNSLYSFTATSQGSSLTNSDGAYPTAGLVLSGNTLYGTASGGGPLDNGTVFAVNTDGTGFRTLHIFSNPNDGVAPESNLILASNTLYGTTYRGGGPLDNGTVFAINTDGTGFRTVYSFSGKSDGAHPRAGLVLSGNTLYGAAARGGNFGWGTAFAVNTDGSGFKTLHSFSDAADGGYPYGGLILSGNALYGTTSRGGSWGWGTVFSISFSPELAIAATGTNVVLSWPTNYAGFDYSGYTLQSSTNFTRPAAWVTNATPAVIVNGQFTVTHPISGAQQFYRLVQ